MNAYELIALLLIAMICSGAVLIGVVAGCVAAFMGFMSLNQLVLEQMDILREQMDTIREMNTWPPDDTSAPTQGPDGDVVDEYDPDAWKRRN